MIYGTLQSFVLLKYWLTVDQWSQMEIYLSSQQSKEPKAIFAY